MCTPINLMDGARKGMGKVICWSALKMRRRITDELQQQTSITEQTWYLSPLQQMTTDIIRQMHILYCISTHFSSPTFTNSLHRTPSVIPHCWALPVSLTQAVALLSVINYPSPHFRYRKTNAPLKHLPYQYISVVALRYLITHNSYTLFRPVWRDIM
jgi:hypothetical protein